MLKLVLKLAKELAILNEALAGSGEAWMLVDRTAFERGRDVLECGHVYATRAEALAVAALNPGLYVLKLLVTEPR